MRSLYNKLDNEMDRARRYKRSLCVLMMDMDHFKRVNDQNDHLFGSFVLFAGRSDYSREYTKKILPLATG